MKIEAQVDYILEIDVIPCIVIERLSYEMCRNIVRNPTRKTRTYFQIGTEMYVSNIKLLCNKIYNLPIK